MNLELDILKTENPQKSDLSVTLPVGELPSKKEGKIHSDLMKDNIFLEGLLNPSNPPNIKDKPISIFNETKEQLSFDTRASDIVLSNKWQLTLNISARLISQYEDKVLLECLINKEEGIYEEREYLLKRFEGYDLTPGSLFLLRFYERPNQSMFAVYNDKGLVNPEDFPKIDMKKISQKSKFLNKKSLL